MPTFGEKFKAWRESKGVSNYKIWKNTGVAQSNLSNMEKGLYMPSDAVLMKLAAFPELGLDYLTLASWRAEEKNPGPLSAAGHVSIKASVYGHATVTPPLQERLSDLAEKLLAGYEEPLFIPCSKCGGSAQIKMLALATKEEFVTACTQCGDPIRVKNEDLAIFRQAHEIIETFRDRMRAISPKSANE